MNNLKCPICGSTLIQKSDSISIRAIFTQWESFHKFSDEVIEDHLKQSSETFLYKCSNCLLEIYLPQVIGSKQFYQEMDDDPNATYYRDEKWDFNEALKDVKKCKEILEIGCGSGSFLSKVQSKTKNIRACGTEYNESALKTCRDKGLEVYGLDDDVEKSVGHFDAVFSFHVLEHVSNPLDFINDISKYLKPNGLLCISVPNQGGPVKNLNNVVMNMPPHHATHWQLKTFLKLADKKNLRVIRIAYEPLLIDNFYEYSYYWYEKTFAKKTIFNRICRKFMPRVLSSFNKLLHGLKTQYFPLFRGQAIYVVMKSK